MSRTVKRPDIRRQELLDIGVKLFFEAGEKEISIDVYKRQHHNNQTNSCSTSSQTC